MTHYYERNDNGYTVTWSPPNETAAEEAVEEVVGELGKSVSQSQADEIQELYNDIMTSVLSISLDDGDVVGDGEDTEAVTISLEDTNGNPVEGDYTVVLDVDDYKYDVSITDGSGVHELTTGKDAGSNVSVQALDVVEFEDETAEDSREKAVNVV